MLSGANDASESAAYMVEVALGRYSSNLITDWDISLDVDHDDAAASLTDHPNVWTDGSLVLDRVSGVSSSGSGFFAHQADRFWRGCRWGHVDGIHHDLDRACCRGFSSVLGPLQTVQRAEMWGVVLALQSSSAVHLGVDNLGVVRHVDQLLRGCRGPRPFQLINDGDLLLLLEHMLHRRGLDTVRISKVKGHADDAMVLHGQVRQDDRLGNNAADEAADFGRRRVSPAVIDARRNLSGDLWSLVSCYFLTFIDFSLPFLELWSIMMVLVATAPDPLVWSAGALRKRRRLVHAVRDRAFLPGPPGIWQFWSGFRFQLLPSVLRILLFGLIPLVFWLSGFLF